MSQLIFDKERARALNLLKTDLPTFASHCLRIRDKQGRITPLIFNREQLYAHAMCEDQLKRTGMVRKVILKGRQQGMSTYAAARFFHKTLLQPGAATFILSHEGKSTSVLFDIVKRYYDRLPSEIVPMRPELGASNKNQLKFLGTDSEYTVGTAGNEDIGRSMTLKHLHMSEVAFYDRTDQLETGLMQAVADMPGTEVLMESTANGLGNMFHDRAMKAMAGIGSYEMIFIPWFWNEGYRRPPPEGFTPDPDEQRLMKQFDLQLDQVYWRRMKIENTKGGLWTFQQEYPCIAGHMRVMCERGNIRIDEVQPGDKTAQGVVIRKMNKGVKECIRLVFKSGRELVLTPEHRVQTDDGFVEAKDSVGKKISMSTKVFPTDYVTETIPVHKSVKTQLCVDKDFARLLGYYMGDGSTYNDTFSFVSNVRDTEVIDDVFRLFTSVTGNKIQKRVVGKKGIELRFHDKYLAEVFTHLGLFVGGRRKVCVPDVIWRSPRACVAEFLRALIVTDGFVYDSGAIRIFSKHRDFCYDMQQLFAALGYKADIRLTSKKSGNGGVYTGGEINILSHEGRRFKEEFGFLSTWQSNRTRTTKPYPDRDPGFFDTVVRIEPYGPAEVFDLEVPETATFNTQGLVVHNCTADEAFLMSGESFFSKECVVNARRCKAESPGDIIVAGLDCARGNDRSVFVVRQGRKVIHYECHKDLRAEGLQPTQQLIAHSMRIIDTFNVDKMFIDMGSGYGVVDGLKSYPEYQSVVVGVPFQQRVLDEVRFLNKRAEMYGLARDWLEEGNVSIPDTEEFCIDLLLTGKEKETPTKRMYLPPKTEIKTKHKVSPDITDGFVLTFAFPVPKRRDGFENRATRRRQHTQQSSLETINRINRGSQPSSSVSINVDL